MTAINLKGLEPLLSRLTKVQTLDKAMNTATKRTERGAKTIASRSIREELALPKRKVDEELKVFGNYREGAHSISIHAQKRGILFRNFRHSINRRGHLRVTIKPGAPRVVKRAFMMKLRQGGETPVYWKKKPTHKKGEKGYWDQLALHAPSPSQVLNSKKEEIGSEVAERYKKEIESAVAFHIRKR